MPQEHLSKDGCQEGTWGQGICWERRQMTNTLSLAEEEHLGCSRSVTRSVWGPTQPHPGLSRPLLEVLGLGSEVRAARTFSFPVLLSPSQEQRLIPRENTQVVNEHLFPKPGDSYMIRCYFILLMKIHKKQNGQLARPFIPSSCCFFLESAIPWARAGPAVRQAGHRSLPFTPAPVAAVLPAARQPLRAPVPSTGLAFLPTARQAPRLLFSFPHLLLSLPTNSSFLCFAPNQTAPLSPSSFQHQCDSFLFQEVHPDRADSVSWEFHLLPVEPSVQGTTCSHPRCPGELEDCRPQTVRLPQSTQVAQGSSQAFSTGGEMARCRQR
nr:uncharacterized protein LOC105882698 [Microcebus murinus]